MNIIRLQHQKFNFLLERIVFCYLCWKRKEFPSLSELFNLRVICSTNLLITAVTQRVFLLVKCYKIWHSFWIQQQKFILSLKVHFLLHIRWVLRSFVVVRISLFCANAAKLTLKSGPVSRVSESPWSRFPLHRKRAPILESV